MKITFSKQIFFILLFFFSINVANSHEKMMIYSIAATVGD